MGKDNMRLFKRRSIAPAKTNDAIITVGLDTVLVNDGGLIESREQISLMLFRQQVSDGSSIEMVMLPDGTYAMGSAHREGHPDEEPLHYVRVRKFFLSQTTITQRQWKAVMKNLPPCRGKGLDLPVDRISWLDAQAFCERLSRIAGREYRLPSEAEWEYACRAGSLMDFSFGNMITPDLANYVGWHSYKGGPKGSYRHGPIQAKTFPPNRFGLYDMHGNLSEWCLDTWHDDYNGAPLDGEAWIRGGTDERVIRGGSWHDPPDLCRCSSRLKLEPTEAEDFVGIRIALSET
jgi:formylglycine-generating enzyme required for sulfatase activity